MEERKETLANHVLIPKSAAWKYHICLYFSGKASRVTNPEVLREEKYNSLTGRNRNNYEK